MPTAPQQSNSNETTISSTTAPNTNESLIVSNDVQTSEVGTDIPSTQSNVSGVSWRSVSNNSRSVNQFDSQKQRLNQLIELISNQETKLNRLKALRKLAKEQTAINIELSNELKTVNSSINEKDVELRKALNRVDNLNRQLTNYRRTHANRNSNNVTSSKQLHSNLDNSNLMSSDDNNSAQNVTTIQKSSNECSKLSANGHNKCDSVDFISSDLNPGKLSLFSKISESPQEAIETSSDKSGKNDLLDDQEHNQVDVSDRTGSLDSNKSDDSRSNSTPDNTIHVTSTQSAHQTQNHLSPAINARQKLIDSGLQKVTNNLCRRVSFDPLALLLDAALEGELELVIETSKQVPDLSACHDECVTALHNAVVAGHYNVAKYLIDAGCDINVQDSDGWTPLHCAANTNNLRLVKLLIENGALIYTTTISDNATPAMKCERKEEGFEDCYKYLMYVQNNLGVINNGVVYALYDYEAQEADELSFNTDEELTVLRRDDSQEQEWWWAQKRIQQTSDTLVDIKEGYIPRNLVGLYPRVKAFKRSIKPKTPNNNSVDDDAINK